MRANSFNKRILATMAIALLFALLLYGKGTRHERMVNYCLYKNRICIGWFSTTIR